MATPLTASSRILNSLSTPVPKTAPTMPVLTTRTAVSDGIPPSFSEMPIATGAVTDLGASEIRVAISAPSQAASPIAVRLAVSTPTSRAAPIGTAKAPSRSRCRYSGIASATVAGPSRK